MRQYLPQLAVTACAIVCVASSLLSSSSSPPSPVSSPYSAKAQRSLPLSSLPSLSLLGDHTTRSPAIACRWPISSRLVVALALSPCSPSPHIATFTLPPPSLLCANKNGNAQRHVALKCAAITFPSRSPSTHHVLVPPSPHPVPLALVQSLHQARIHRHTCTVECLMFNQSRGRYLSRAEINCVRYITKKSRALHTKIARINWHLQLHSDIYSSSTN